MAYSYLRFSKPEQMKGDSQRRQLEASREWCKLNGAELVEEFQDHGVSAFRGKNRMLGVLSRFLELVRAGQVMPGTFFIIENIDRLSREKVLEALTLYLELIKAGVSIVTLIDGQTHSRESIHANPMVLQMAIAGMARANEESAIKSRRINSAWEQSRKDALAGKPSTMGRLPCWLKRNPKTKQAELIPGPASVVRELFEMAAEGMGMAAITVALNKAKRPPLTTRGRGVCWSVSTVRKIIQSKSAMGTLELNEPYRDEDGKKRYRKAGEVAGYYPAAVSPELFAKVATLYRTRSKQNTHNTGGSKMSDRNAFSGLARELVTGCGVRYTFSTRRSAKTGKMIRREYLRAHNTINAGKGFASFAWDYNDFTELFVRTCRLALKAATKVSKEEAGLAVLQNQVMEASDSMAALLEMAKKATSAKAELLAELEKEASRKAKLESEAEALRDKITAAKKKGGNLPRDLSDRVKLRNAFRSNVASLQIDFENKLFRCKLYNGTAYTCWLSPEDAVFVETNDFEVPAETFKGLKLRQGWGHRIRRRIATGAVSKPAEEMPA